MALTRIQLCKGGRYSLCLLRVINIIIRKRKPYFRIINYSFLFMIFKLNPNILLSFTRKIYEKKFIKKRTNYNTDVGFVLCCKGYHAQRNKALQASVTCINACALYQ